MSQMNSRVTVGKNSGGTCEKLGLSSEGHRKSSEMSVQKASGLSYSSNHRAPLGRIGKDKIEKGQAEGGI